MNANVIDGEAAIPRIVVKRGTVDRLAATGLISSAARDFAFELIEPPRRWGVWVSRLLTVVGTALVLSGIVYFFAFNWNHIPPMAKLGGIAALIVAAFLTVVFVGFGRLVTDVAGSAAVVLVGVFLAVEGQIHQTGADAWQLFAGWAGLTLLWAILTGSAATWAVWLVVANLAVITWWLQTHHDDFRRSGMWLSLVVLDGGFLVARELLAARGQAWASGRWTRIVPALPVLAVVTLASFWLWDRTDAHRPVDWAMTLTIPVVLVGFLGVYHRRLPDLAVLSAAAIAACVVLDFLFFQLVTRNGRSNDMGTFLLMGFVTLGIFAIAVASLRAASRSMEA